jgi:hypothetical protein
MPGPAVGPSSLREFSLPPWTVHVLLGSCRGFIFIFDFEGFCFHMIE